MNNINQLLYFVSQSYRQVQLSVDKGLQNYPYSEFSTQFARLLNASGDEAYARQLTIELVEETARYKQTTDYLRQEMAFETQASTLGDWAMALELDTAGLTDSDLYARRTNRHTNHTDHFAEEWA
ncbi:hypothetical protein [Spirosoma spitsbergense]|uniref:hypothetical protein n=1 Tax=Spirosoma spitsbergense TaxID=431554 RepID=UPI00037E2630|nr:hypothetical protein [Spirosoma spitsbergense]